MALEPVGAFSPSLAEVIPVSSVHPRTILPLDLLYNRTFKRCVDWVVATLLIIGLLIWLIPLIGLLIKISSPGPVFFIQKRIKRGGRQFWCIKFRTMVPNQDADRTPAGINDPRITRIGRLLRRHHIDELPQLFNVWWGDMSLIGPRPYMIHDDEQYGRMVQDYGLRYKVKPGITGLAQSLGYFGLLQDTCHLHQRVELDLQYVRYWSARMDWQIIWRTVHLVWHPGDAPANKQTY
jgi:putative colanic acid biosysnthesis UDP-glucose lipid carrier transferase